MEPQASLDLRGTPCPLNFIRTRLALETCPVGGWLEVDLDAGEPEEMVRDGLRSEGHHVEVPETGDRCSGTVRLRIRRGG